MGTKKPRGETGETTGQKWGGGPGTEAPRQTHWKRPGRGCMRGDTQGEAGRKGPSGAGQGPKAPTSLSPSCGPPPGWSSP